MGFFNFLKGVRTRTVELNSKDILRVTDLLEDDALEFGIREVIFSACVNMVAGYFSKAEVRFFRDGQEEKDGEYWIWNVQPNKNQNATAFWHELVDRLYRENEVLIIDEPYGDGVVIAEAFTADTERAVTVYHDVVYRNSFQSRLRENQVMHLTLNNKDISKLIVQMQNSYIKLASAAMQNYVFNTGQHWKAVVDDLAPGEEDRSEALQKLIEAQVKPFLSSKFGVLPQLNGYDYQQISGDKPGSSKDIQELIDAVWNDTTKPFGIPIVLINGEVADDKTAMTRFLSGPIDTLARQVEQELNRKRIKREGYLAGDRMVVDTSNLIHYDIMENASNLQALIGSAVYSVNDILRSIGKATIREDWADKHYLTLNIGQSPVEDKPDEPAD